MAISPPPAEVYRPRGRIRDLWAYRGREVLVAGPAGTGKSRGCLEKLDNLARLYPGMRGLICRKWRVTLTQSALVTMTRVLGPDQAERTFHHTDQEFRYANGSVIAVAGLDDSEKIRSSEYDCVYAQEATELEQDDWSMLLRGLRNNRMPYQQLMADCNPASPQHWLKVRCDVGTTHLIESRHEDNPILWDTATADWTPFGRTYIAGLDSLSGYLYQRLRLGLWVAAQGMYFTEFDPNLHLVSSFDPPEDWVRWVAVDYGFAHPFVALWFARERPAGRIVVYREVSAVGLRDEQQAQLILERSAGEAIQQVILDPSMFNARAEQNRPSIAQVYDAAGVRLMARGGIWPGQNNRKQGWAIVRRALAHGTRAAEERGVEVGDLPRLRIMRERCPNLIRNLPAMVHDVLDPEDLADKVGAVRTPDDEVDALRYGLAAEALPPRPDVRGLVFG
jgi:PBSX family phage terminase large subunit